MELFSKYKAAALADVALGDCIVLRYSLGQDKGYRHTVAIKIARGEEDERDTVGGMSAAIALWSEEGSPALVLFAGAPALATGIYRANESLNSSQKPSIYCPPTIFVADGPNVIDECSHSPQRG